VKSIVRVIKDIDVIKIAIEPNRRRILALLNSQDMTVSELANALRKDISTVYRHMHKLEGAGLIESSGERRVHNIPEKVFRRTAKHFLFSPEAVKMMDEGMFTEYSQSTSEALLSMLEEMGYDIERGEEYDRNFQKMLMRWNQLVAEGLEKISDKEGKEISLPMYILLMLSVSLIRLETDTELKRTSELFVSKIKNRSSRSGRTHHST
jgi:DNA-binding transcriptional ArsR family regulator